MRLDKKYRYVSEQVSHHPPISACWAESPLWRYFGEVRVLIDCFLCLFDDDGVGGRAKQVYGQVV